MTGISLADCEGNGKDCGSVNADRQDVN